MNEEERKTYYTFGHTSFWHEVWINHEHTFPNESPHGLCITVWEETSNAFSLAVYDKYGNYVGKGLVSAHPHPMQIRFRLSKLGPGPFKLKLHNESMKEETKRFTHGEVSDCPRSLADIDLIIEKE